MDTISVEILFILLLTVVNGVFAMSEIAVVASNKSRLQQRAQDGDERARMVLDISRTPNDFLSTVQVGITLIGVMAGAFGGATIAQELAAFIAEVPALEHYAESVAVVIVVIGITYVSLVIGELVPKRLALGQPEKIATLVIRPMHHISRLTTPIVWLLSASTNALLRLIRVQKVWVL